MDDLTNYRQTYIKTAKEYADLMATQLSVLEIDPTNESAIEEVYRISHSLKSSSVAMRYSNTASLCGIFEDIFKKIKDGTLESSEELIQIVKDSADRLKKSISHIELDNTEIDLSSELRKLRMIGKLEKIIEY